MGKKQLLNTPRSSCGRTQSTTAAHTRRAKQKRTKGCAFVPSTTGLDGVSFLVFSIQPRDAIAQKPPANKRLTIKHKALRLVGCTTVAVASSVGMFELVVLWLIPTCPPPHMPNVGNTLSWHSGGMRGGTVK